MKIALMVLLLALAGCESITFVGYECRDYTIWTDPERGMAVDSVTYTVSDTVKTREECH